MSGPTRISEQADALVPPRREMTAWDWRAAVILGGLAGSALRVGLEAWWSMPSDGWPWPTFVVNLSGAFLLGVLLPRLAALGGRSALLLPLVGVGLLGALTTFSLFIYEAWLLIEHQRELLAAGYVLATLGAGLALAIAGDRLAHAVGSGAAR